MKNKCGYFEVFDGCAGDMRAGSLIDAALDILGIKNVYSSPIVISNPAPATIELIKGLPVIFRNIPYEISTPTGVSILKFICGRQREIKEVKTKWGRERVKVSFSGEKIYNISPEYEDCMKISKKNNIPLKQVLIEVNNLSKNLTL